MKFIQREFYLKEKPRGYHLITDEVLQAIPELTKISTGLINVFIKHTSASLTINENADPDVRKDMRSFTDKLVPENLPYFLHLSEGPDDMPAHIKTSLLGSSLVIPITDGNLNLGTWQGIYLCEHRNNGGPRKIVTSIIGI